MTSTAENLSRQKFSYDSSARETMLLLLWVLCRGCRHAHSPSPTHTLPKLGADNTGHILCHIPCLMAGHLKEVLYSLSPLLTSKHISPAAAWVRIHLITLLIIRSNWTFIPFHGMMMPLLAVDAIWLGTFRPGWIIPRCQAVVAHHHLPASLLFVFPFSVYLSAFLVTKFFFSWPFIIATLSTLCKVFFSCIFSLKLIKKNSWLFDC